MIEAGASITARQSSAAKEKCWRNKGGARRAARNPAPKIMVANSVLTQHEIARTREVRKWSRKKRLWPPGQLSAATRGSAPARGR